MGERPPRTQWVPVIMIRNLCAGRQGTHPCRWSREACSQTRCADWNAELPCTTDRRTSREEQVTPVEISLESATDHGCPQRRQHF